MATNNGIGTLIQRNQNLLNSIYKFKANSKLHHYITRKGGGHKTLFTLAEILTILRETIRGEGQYDETNPSIIVCSQDLESALDMKALHVTEIRNLVLKHLINWSNKDCQTPARDIKEERTTSPKQNLIPTQRLIHTANMTTTIKVNKHAEVTCKPKFLSVLQSLTNYVDKNKTTFTFEETTTLLSIYILKNKDKFFDKRNIKLAMVKGDPLGEAFGVNTFHRCQVNNLLRGQLIPLNPDLPTHEFSVTANTSPGVDVTIRSMPPQTIPIKNESTDQPTGTTPSTNSIINQTQNLSLNPSSSLKRLNSHQLSPNENIIPKFIKLEDPMVENIIPKFIKLEDPIIISAIPPCHEQTETNYINQAQNRNSNEVKIEDEDKNESMDNESKFDSDETEYEITEYEPDTYTQTERPPQAGGRSNCNAFTNLTDTDSDVNTSFKNMRKEAEEIESKKVKQESIYWGDISEDEPSLKNEHSNLLRATIWNCTGCKKPILLKPYFRYCNPCWTARKEWIGSHKRKRKRKDRKIIIPNLDSENKTKGPENPGKLIAPSHLCLLCCTRVKNATLVHGKIGHQVSCYPCAKRLWMTRSDCPVCRRKIEKIIKVIPA